MKLALFLYLISTFVTQQGLSFCRGRLSIQRPVTRGSITTSLRAAEDGVPLTSIDFEKEGKYLSASIKQYLDDEFIKQDIHSIIGDAVGAVYIAERRKGVSDLGDMLLRMGGALESLDMKEAFVGPWDVANKVADLLMFRMGRELCSCTEDLSKFTEDDSSSTGNKPKGAIFIVFDGGSTKTPDFCRRSAVVSAEYMKSNLENLSNEFQRYIFLRDFAEGDRSWSEVHPVIAACLGFRAENENDVVVQIDELTPQVASLLLKYNFAYLFLT
jgi:hypothetical protein